MDHISLHWLDKVRYREEKRTTEREFGSLVKNSGMRMEDKIKRIQTFYVEVSNPEIRTRTLEASD